MVVAMFDDMGVKAAAMVPETRIRPHFDFFSHRSLLVERISVHWGYQSTRLD